MTDLASRPCVQIAEGTPHLSVEKRSELMNQLNDGWKVVKEHHLERTFTFPNFVKSLEFTNKVGGIAEGEQHHPDIFLTWGRVTITVWTHTIDGLSETDFIFAAKCDALSSN
jgi:4a-hydroxytetrahydrobiopterin dehydratase